MTTSTTTMRRFGMMVAMVVLTACGQEPVAAPDATLDTLQVVLDAASVPAGLTARATALATYSDGTVVDVTGQVTWTASSAAAEVQADGQVLGVSPGLVELQASFAGAAGAGAFEVTAAAPVALRVTGLEAVLPLGIDVPFQVEATFTDGSVGYVTAGASVEALDAAVATLNAVQGQAGMQYVRGLQAGTSALRVSYAGLTADSQVEFTSVSIDHLTISAPSDTVVVGAQFSFSATATMTNGLTVDMTSQVIWISSRFQRLSVEANGAATALRAGTVTVTALDPLTFTATNYTVTITD